MSQCRVCAAVDLRVAMDVDATPRGIPETRRYVVCVRCGSLMDVVGIPRFTGKDAHAPLTDETPSVKFYLEVGAGIESFATLLCLLEKALGTRSGAPHGCGGLLDVGAGFGFMVSMARARGWQAVGLEPSGMGRVGSDILDVPILSDPLECARIPEGAFNAIVSCEVVEHVANPGSFIATLARHLAPGGVLVLTTPNGEVIRGQAATEREWYEALSPGDHLTLLSPLAMDLLLRAHGFDDVRLLLMGGTSGRKHIIAIAAREHGSLPPAFEWDVVCQEGQQLALGYLEELTRRRELAGHLDVLYGGALFRMARILIHRGAYADAAVPLRKLEAHLCRTQALGGLMDATNASFDEYVSRYPAFIGEYYFLRGIYGLNYAGDYTEAAQSFGLAATLCRIEHRVGHFPRVGWAERATLHQGLALLRSGRYGDALALFDGLLKDPSRVPAEYLSALYRGKVIAHAELEQYEAARDFLCSLIGDTRAGYRRRYLVPLRRGVRRAVRWVGLRVGG